MAHESFQPSAYRPDPIDTLIQQGHGRLEHLLPIRYAWMTASPFAFFQGSSGIMAWDLSHTASTNLNVQLCGDAQLSNFGFVESPERALVLDIQNFDETMPGPFEWDIKRLASSAVLAGRSIGLSNANCLEVAQSCVREYRNKMFEFSEMTTLEIWNSHVTVESLLESLPNARRRKKVLGEFCRNETKRGQGAVGTLVTITNGTLHFVDRPPHIVRLPENEVESVILPAVQKYISTLSDEHQFLLDHYRYVDSARSLGGISHMGIQSYIVALAGNDESDLLLLKVAEGVSSVVAQYVPSLNYRNEAERVVQGQRLIQAVADPFLGWGRDSLGRDYYIRQLLNIKLSTDLAPMKASLFKVYASLCGGTLARAHARSGDPFSISAYLGKNEQFDEAVARFAMRYADQIEVDHAALIAAVQSGRVVAEVSD